MVVVLNNIRSMHNVGSIFRTADGAGVKKIYLCGVTPTPIDRLGKSRPQVSKVSLGAEKNIEWEKISSTVSCIKKLKREGYKIFAVEQSPNSMPYYEFRGIRMNSRFRIAFVFGNEVNGLSSSILKLADKVLEIPMYGKKESLNISVSAGVVLFWFVNTIAIKKNLAQRG
jgi:23S rRNA (guanosine2251-2'-O)-methyltransferase